MDCEQGLYGISVVDNDIEDSCIVYQMCEQSMAHVEVQDRQTRLSHRAFFVSALLLTSRRAANRRIASAHVSPRNFDTSRRCSLICKYISIDHLMEGKRRTYCSRILHRTRLVIVRGHGLPTLHLSHLNIAKIRQPDLPETFLPVRSPRHACEKPFGAPYGVIPSDHQRSERREWKGGMVLES